MSKLLDTLTWTGDHFRGLISGKGTERVTARELFGIEDNPDSYGDDIATFFLDMLTDPLTYVPFGALFGGGKALAKGAKLAGPRFKHADDLMRAAGHADDVSVASSKAASPVAGYTASSKSVIPRNNRPSQLLSPDSGTTNRGFSSPRDGPVGDFRGVGPVDVNAPGFRFIEPSSDSFGPVSSGPAAGSSRIPRFESQTPLLEKAGEIAPFPKEVLSYLPPGSRYIGSGVEATAFKTPSGKVIRIERIGDVSDGTAVGRLKHKDITQPYSSHTVPTSEGLYSVEALPHANALKKEIAAKTEAAIKNPTTEQLTKVRETLIGKAQRRYDNAYDEVTKARQAVERLGMIPKDKRKLTLQQLYREAEKTGDTVNKLSRNADIRALTRSEVPRHLVDLTAVEDLGKLAAPHIEQNAIRSAGLADALEKLHHLDNAGIHEAGRGQIKNIIQSQLRNQTADQGKVLQKNLLDDLGVRWTDNHSGNLGRTDDGIMQIIDPGHMRAGPTHDAPIIQGHYPKGADIPDLPFNSVTQHPANYKSRLQPIGDALGYQKWTQDAMFSPRLRSPALRQALLGQGLISAPIGAAYGVRTGQNPQNLQ